MGIARTAWIGIALGATLVCAGAVLDAKLAPGQATRVAAPKTASDGRFAAVCKSGEIVDSRPDPAWVSANYGGDNCVAPVQPKAINGLTARREQVVAAMAAAKHYDASAALFQKCIRDFVAQRDGTRPLSKTQAIIENHRIASSQRAQQTVAALTRNTINDFNQYGSDCPG